MKGVAAQNPPKGKPAALQGAVLFDGLHGVLRAGWNKAAAGGTVRGDPLSVKVDKTEKKFFHRKRPSLSERVIKLSESSEYFAETALYRATATIS